jgi:hypothetical protein
MLEARLFGENLVLGRKIICKYGENKITINDTVENLGFRKEALMLLFHFNMGYPLLDEDAILVTPTGMMMNKLGRKRTVVISMAEEMYRLLNVNESEFDILELTPEQKSAIETAQEQYRKGLYLSQEQADNEIEEWLGK